MESATTLRARLAASSAASKRAKAEWEVAWQAAARLSARYGNSHPATIVADAEERAARARRVAASDVAAYDFVLWSDALCRSEGCGYIRFR